MNDTADTVTNKPDPAHPWNVLCHLSALSGLISPFFFVLGPLLIWLLKRNEFTSVDVNGKEAVNFQLSCFLYSIISLFLIIILIGPILLAIVAVGNITLTIIASIKVSNGEVFRYPLTIQFIK